MGIVVDLHSDMLNDIHPRRAAGESKVLENRWLPGMRRGAIDVRVVAIYTDVQYTPELALRRGLDLIATLYEEIEGSASAMLCLSSQDLLEAKARGMTGFVLGMEGAEPLGRDLQLLTIFYRLGLRVLGLTHALRTYLADGAFQSPKRSGQPGGLTETGVSFLEVAQDMGILIDVSHLNEPGFWDVIHLSRAPIIASHSNCRALFDHPRNLSDKQIRAVARGGGVIGVNACRLFHQSAHIESYLDHIDHLVDQGGLDHVGLGPDFNDYLLPHLSEGEKARFPVDGLLPLDGFAGDEDFPHLAAGLSKRGYSDRQIELIMGENVLRVFREVLKPPKPS